MMQRRWTPGSSLGVTWIKTPRPTPTPPSDPHHRSPVLCAGHPRGDRARAVERRLRRRGPDGDAGAGAGHAAAGGRRDLPADHDRAGRHRRVGLPQGLERRIVPSSCRAPCSAWARPGFWPRISPTPPCASSSASPRSLSCSTTGSGHGRCRIRASRRVAPGLFWGSIAGFTSTICQAGGPPYQMYVLGLTLPKMVYVSTNAIVFAAMNWMKLVPLFRARPVFTKGRGNLAALLPLAMPPTGSASGWCASRRPSCSTASR